jgi:hypothetical protein
MTLAAQILSFYRTLKIKSDLPEGVVVLNPYVNAQSFFYCEQFYNKYYDDREERTIILGINPGRHGGGITGIPFTDPIKLEQYCGIVNPFAKKPELSADFIYTMINAFGGPDVFYRKFYFGSVSPLGFTQGGKNLNYYDIKTLQHSLKPFIVESLLHQLSFNINRAICYCLGEGENFKFLNQLNEELQVFKKIVPLAHPRFIMQYRRKKVSAYVEDYFGKLNGN